MKVDNVADDGTLGKTIPLLFINPVKENLSKKELEELENKIIKEQGKSKDEIANFDEIMQSEINKLAREKGLKCSKNAFWQVIRNPIYCGKIFIPAFKDEESCFVEGQHDAIITENIFEQVQEILDGRGRKYSKNRK